MTTVLHIIEHLSEGGASRSTLETSRYSHELDNFEHIIVSLLAPVSPEMRQMADRLELQIVEAPDNIELNRLINGADIVQVQFWNNPTMMRFLTDVTHPTRLLIWSHIFGAYPPQVITDALIDVADRVITSSPLSLDLPVFKKLTEADFTRKTTPFHLAPDFSRLEGLVLREHEGFNVGYIGLVNPVKMHPNYVQMSASIDIPKVKFVVCGDGMIDLFRRQAEELGAGERFQWRGYVANIGPILETMDVFGYPLSPNTYASSERSLQEAMYLGIPPVVFPYGGVTYMVKDGETGLVVRNEQEYRQAIEYLHHNPDVRRRIGKAAQEFVKNHLGVDKCALRLNTIYTEMIQQPRTEKRIKPDFNTGFTGSTLFIASLGEHSKPFRDSVLAQNIQEASQADEQIATAPSMLKSVGSGGIKQYKHFFQDDPYLRLWAGLALEGDGQLLEAIPEYYTAAQLGRSLAERTNQYSQRIEAKLHQDDLNIAALSYLQLGNSYHALELIEKSLRDWTVGKPVPASLSNIDFWLQVIVGLKSNDIRWQDKFQASETDRAARLGVIQQQGHELDTLKAEVQPLRQQIDELNRNFQNIEADRAARLEIIQRQGQQLGILDAEKNNLGFQLEDLKKHFAASEADRAARLEVIQQQQQQIADLQQQIADLQQQIGDSQQQIADLQQQLGDSQQQIVNLTDKLTIQTEIINMTRQTRTYKLLKKLGMMKSLKNA